jgi:hypothetical protein
MSACYRVNFQAATNEDLRQAFVLQDAAGAAIDLTGASLRMALQGASGAIALEAGLADGRIAILDAANGRFEVAVLAADLQTLPPGVYRHDLLLAQAGVVRRVWSGVLTLSQGVTA